MGLLDTLRSWLGLGGDADADGDGDPHANAEVDTPAADETDGSAADETGTEAADETGTEAAAEPKLDPSGVTETRVESTDSAVDALKQARNEGGDDDTGATPADGPSAGADPSTERRDSDASADDDS
ncbi:hypothetical protein PM076_07585 [Halorubrum ezzemoulense]|uniref:Signal recognition particle-docking protein FtsY n=1 Tax=Halorubrum ezzemoulense TaxID=337243 RepID=A0ABT4YZW7_HALEZ|nr:hypothetical protein [Halorubrum ezzemoulense]MDB2243335.1 hypothetical protein [Halorubrum ezzemoulense]MDB2251401.1 hypothetical protein [Halorubrum ezzemoulense]MDB2277071.1 hypothetical protein [Halorubrum ezzemoulense]MDB2283781.1 hypothetical protein [Halorubrum ezzemoulense]MDB2288698.1 hypothetical protein [Halorubrum ezzemoulense]